VVDFGTVVVACIVGLLVGAGVYFGLLSVRWMDRYSELYDETLDYWRSLYTDSLWNTSWLANMSLVSSDALCNASVNDALMNQVVSLLDEKKSLLSEIGRLERENQVLQDLVAGKNITGQCAEVIDGLRSQIRGLNDRIACLSSNITALKGNISRLKSEVSFLSPYKGLYERAASNWSFYLNALAPRNFSEYITPDDPLVKAKVREILGSHADGDLTWADMRDIVLWVVAHTEDPGFDLPSFGYNWSFWQKPAEVLRSGYGDSSDCARLAVSLMKAEDSSADYVYCAEFSFESFSRTVVVVNAVQNQMIIYDPVSGWQPNVGPELSVMGEYSSQMHAKIMNVPVLYDNHLVMCFRDTIKFLQWL